MDECKFREGDRVQLVDREPVFKKFRGAVGTVIDISRGANGIVVVIYDNFGRLRSDPATLVLINDSVDATELNSFLDNQ